MMVEQQMGMIVQLMHAQSTLKKSVLQDDVQGSSSEHEHGHCINGSPLPYNTSSCFLSTIATSILGLEGLERLFPWTLTLSYTPSLKKKAIFTF